MAVPIKKTAIAVGVVMVSGGALITLAHDQTPFTHSNGDERGQQSSSDVQGVVENPPVDVEINGQQVPVQPGTTSFDTDTGKATINASNDRVEVNHQSSSNTPGNVDVNIKTESHGNSNTSTRYRSSTRSSSESSSTSSVKISTDGDTKVNIEE